MAGVNILGGVKKIVESSSPRAFYEVIKALVTKLKFKQGSYTLTIEVRPFSRPG